MYKPINLHRIVPLNINVGPVQIWRVRDPIHTACETEGRSGSGPCQVGILWQHGLKKGRGKGLCAGRAAEGPTQHPRPDPKTSLPSALKRDNIIMFYLPSSQDLCTRRTNQLQININNKFAKYFIIILFISIEYLYMRCFCCPMNL